MTIWLKQSTAVTVKMGPFVDETDGVTAETGLTIAQADIRLTKNGGNFAQTNNAAGATHDEDGYYDVPLNTTDTNTLGTLRVAVSESGALPVWQDFMVVPANVWDSMFGADNIQVHAVEIADDLITSDVIALDAIQASAIAANAIGSSELATSAVTEIATAVNAEVVDVMFTDVIADTTPADGSRPTIGQAVLMIARFLMEKDVSGTTVTVNKEDGTTTAMTFTLDSGTAPTSITRAT